MEERTYQDHSDENSDLDGKESWEVDHRMAPRAVVVHETIRREGEGELERSSSALWWSGLAAGLSMGFSMVTEGLLASHLPQADWTPLITKFGYSIGFLIVILGRQQLFTENTLTPILHLLCARKIRIMKDLVRLWVVVLAANLSGAVLFAWVAVHGDIFPPELHAAFTAIGKEAVDGGFLSGTLSAVFAGWLIALIIWLMPFAETGRIWVIIIITYLIGLGNFSHIIAGSVEVFYIVINGTIGWSTYFIDFFLPTLLGNMIGGVTLVAAVNHAQVVAGSKGKQPYNI